MMDFENRNGVYVLVHEYRKRRNPSLQAVLT